MVVTSGTITQLKLRKGKGEQRKTGERMLAAKRDHLVDRSGSDVRWKKIG